MDTPPSTQQQTVMIVDDSSNNIRLLAKILGKDYRVRYATHGRDAIDQVTKDPPDLILLDVMMPEMDGFEVCSVLHTHATSRDIPIIMVTALNDNASEMRSFECGAVDFLTKPVNPAVVMARVGAHLALKRERDELARANHMLNQEIEERRKLEKQLREMAEYDALTKLPNRKLFRDRLQQAMLMGERNTALFALLFIDLDRFKWVNDTLGHDAGDDLLVSVSERLKGVVRKSDTVARLGGDEFTIILNDIHHDSMAELVARKVLEQLSLPFEIKGQPVDISGSVGIAIYPDDGTNSEDLVKCADSAMYLAKESGRNTFFFFSPEVNNQAVARIRMEHEMRRALDKAEFFVDYQPKVNVASGTLAGMEALVRWDHPRDGILFPQHFLGTAESSGLIIQIGEWVLKQACQDAVEWIAAGFQTLKLSVNLSAIQFHEPERLVDVVTRTLEETGFPAQNLELELTEYMMIKDPEQATKTLNILKGMGISIAMDDFGTGYSSMALLKRLPIEVIKIDRSFLENLNIDPRNKTFISAMVSMAKKLGLHVVVEGVEEMDHIKMLKKYGSDEVQGFLFSPPLGKNAFNQLLQGKIPLGGGLAHPVPTQ
ncbi:MAG: EAL domain-containing protein [Magnetococcales bacterium]|nr:EAL domain-containing protein [Magnetococcales bacterium]